MRLMCVQLIPFINLLLIIFYSITYRNEKSNYKF